MHDPYSNFMEMNDLRKHTAVFGENLCCLWKNSPDPCKNISSDPNKISVQREKITLKIAGRISFLFLQPSSRETANRRISATTPCGSICEAPLLPGNGANSRDKSKFGSVPETSLAFCDNPLKRKRRPGATHLRSGKDAGHGERDGHRP